mmetsp:Transcript_70103/g.197765  ORF Transcript_70103/g.197765 Transcript_70103/m.197765 type:complete len:227 (-) Transcript_70103:385-1065(-)
MWGLGVPWGFRLSFSGAFIEASPGKPNHDLARTFRNCRYSQSCTWSVTALIPPRGVLTCLRMSGRDWYLSRTSFSTVGSRSQKCWLLSLREQLSLCANSVSASSGSERPESGRRHQSGPCAPTPTLHWLARRPILGYARSMHTVIIFAQVSPRPRAPCTRSEIRSNFSAALSLGFFITGQDWSATSRSACVRSTMLLTRLSSSSSRVRVGIMRMASVSRGSLVVRR